MSVKGRGRCAMGLRNGFEGRALGAEAIPSNWRQACKSSNRSNGSSKHWRRHGEALQLAASEVHADSEGLRLLHVAGDLRPGAAPGGRDVEGASGG